MSKYLHTFDTDSQFEAEYTGPDYKEPWVSYTRENHEVNFNKQGFTIRVGMRDDSDQSIPVDDRPIIYNDSFTKKVPVGCHITDADLGDGEAWEEWAQSVDYNSEGYYAQIQNFNVLFVNDPEVWGETSPLFSGYDGRYRISRSKNTQIAGATVSEDAANQTFTVLMIKQRIM